MWREGGGHLVAQPPGGVVTVLGAVDVVVGVPVTVTVLVLVLVLVVAGGTTAVVVVIVVTLVVAVDDVVEDVVDEVVVADAAAMTPHANRLPVSSAELSPKVPGSEEMTSEVPELFRRSAAVNPLVVVTSFAEPSGRTCKAVSWPLAG
ncbi:hypothetical protein A9W98_26105 [Mycobacterium gordonae]|uniref:Uncharacterized protein n=1 Tax=Mycobacterium gordonae TaxID=1778 RepID=A0A1A6BD53_MYCGO|nr:hypothetical protein A9W98_26105 [Mycobacterium gordonae]